MWLLSIRVPSTVPATKERKRPEGRFLNDILSERFQISRMTGMIRGLRLMLF